MRIKRTACLLALALLAGAAALSRADVVINEVMASNG